MTRATIEIVWPDESFAQFGGHVLEKLFQAREEMTKLRDKRYTVRVTIETIEVDPDTPIRECCRACDGRTEQRE